MMSPRWKLSCEESWAEKSNCAWAKQAWEGCEGRGWLVGTFQEAPTGEVSGCGWESRTELELAFHSKSRQMATPPQEPPAACPLNVCRTETVYTDQQDCLVRRNRPYKL